MPAAQKVEHVQMGVRDLEEALQFYTEAMGLTELARSEGIVYIGAGRDGNYDMAVTEDDTGIDHFAIRVSNSDTIETYETRLSEHDVSTERADGAEPSQEHGLRFALPSGIHMELVTVEDVDYQHSDEIAVPGRGGVAPLDLDHLTYLTPDLRTDAEFLRDHLDFKITEVIGTDENWEGAFTRRGDFHHDVALFTPPETDADHVGLHHVGWKMANIEHMKLFIDSIAQAGVGLEFGIGRHYGGDGIYAYFQEPGGNRFELAAEMATIDVDTTRYTDPDEYISAWGDVLVPESFDAGSGIVT